jgi:DNA repair photolyase
MHEIEAKSILNKAKKIDSWFLSMGGMNIYRGCQHNCAYCDGRAESYSVEGEFGKDVAVKVNAAGLLNRALSPKRKRKPLKYAYVLVGGGVGDSYQPAERKYQLAREALKIIGHHRFPVHILTKSSLVERDLDQIVKINEESGAIVSMSFSCVDDELAKIFEPGCSTPTQRLASLAKFKAAGVATGMFLLPLIPFVTDKPELIDQAVGKAAEIGVDFVLFGGMTLKDGKQKNHFFDVLDGYQPDLVNQVASLYGPSKWGSASSDYYHSIAEVFNVVADRHKVAKRIPSRLFKNILNINDQVIVTLENIDYFSRQSSGKSPYGRAAWTISQLDEPLISMGRRIRQISGVGPAAEKIIREIINTGNSSLHESFFP